MWSAQIRETQSGALRAEPKLVGAPSWGRGDQQVRQSRIYLHDKFSKAQWHEIILGPSGKGWDRTFCYLWDEQIVYAGPILGAPAHDKHTHVLTVSHNDLSVILNRRWMHGVGTSNGEGGYQPSGAFSVSGVSVAGAVNTALRFAYRDAVPLPSWPLPIDFPAVGGGGFAKEWPFHQFQNAAAIVRDLTERDDGPQLDLQPKLVDGLLRWEQRIGTLTGPTFDVNLAAERSAAVSTSYGIHGEDTATGIHYPGNGAGEDMRVGAAFLPVSEGLARDAIFYNKNERDIPTLVSQAQGRLDGLGPVVRRPLTVKAAMINPAQVRIGSLFHVLSDDDRWEPERETFRAVGFTSATRDTFDLELQKT